jgi:hypothetical protein
MVTIGNAARGLRFDIEAFKQCGTEEWLDLRPAGAIEATLDPAPGLVTWTLSSINPATRPPARKPACGPQCGRQVASPAIRRPPNPLACEIEGMERWFGPG